MRTALASILSFLVVFSLASQSETPNRAPNDAARSAPKFKTMKLYIMKAEWLPEFLKLATSEPTPDPGEFDAKVRSANVNVVEGFGRGELLEGYLGILDDHDIEITGDDHTAKLDSATEGRFAWMKITGKEAQKIGPQIERLKLGAGDFENYFGEPDPALMRELEMLHRGFKDALKKIGANEVGLLRSQL